MNFYLILRDICYGLKHQISKFKIINKIRYYRKYIYMKILHNYSKAGGGVGSSTEK